MLCFCLFVLSEIEIMGGVPTTYSSLVVSHVRYFWLDWA